MRLLRRWRASMSADDVMHVEIRPGGRCAWAAKADLASKGSRRAPLETRRTVTKLANAAAPQKHINRAWHDAIALPIIHSSTLPTSNTAKQ